MRNIDNRVFSEGTLQIIRPFGNGHRGVDVINVNAVNQEISAHSAGEVIFYQIGVPNKTDLVGTAKYGNCVWIKHTGGYTIRYAHLDMVGVSFGQIVGRGQYIGTMGNSGECVQPCLHFEVLDTQQQVVNAELYLRGDLPGCPTLPVVPFPEEYTTGIYEVAEDLVNVRCGPGFTYRWLEYADFDEEVQREIARRDRNNPDNYICGMSFEVFEVSKKWGRSIDGWIFLDYCRKL